MVDLELITTVEVQAPFIDKRSTQECKVFEKFLKSDGTDEQ